MTPWQALALGLSALAAVAILYGLHRLGLWLEARGHLYYRHKKPEGGAARAIFELQKAVEPEVRHVVHVRDERRHHAENEAPGSGHGPPGAPRGDGAG